MHKESFDWVFESSEAKVCVICDSKNRDRYKTIKRGRLIGFRIYLDQVTVPVSIELAAFEELSCTAIILNVWSGKMLSLWASCSTQPGMWQVR